MTNAGVHDDLDREVPSGDERWLLIDRIVASSAFRKAGRLRELLHYLAELSIRGSIVELSEQRIGETVFGKPKGYSPVEDSSVRVHMRQLRLKLHEYFDSEGCEEPLIVEIPKGSYGLVFHPARVAVPPVETPSVPVATEAAPAQVTAPPRTRSWGMLAPWVLCVIFAGFSLVSWVRSRPPAQASLSWPLSEVFNGVDSTQIVLADATYTIRRMLSGKSASLEEYLKRDAAPPTSPASADIRDVYLKRYANALLTSWADVALSTALIKLSPNRADQVTVRSARDFRMRDLKDGNYVFLGSPASNPWVLLFENRLNFQEVRGEERNRPVKYFRNRNPVAGEPATYAGLPRTGVDGDDYAVIDFLPVEGKRGNILIVQGLQQEGTEAAGLFLCDESGRAKLREALGLKGRPNQPVYFEVLLRIRAVDGSPASTSIVASRVIKP